MAYRAARYFHAPLQSGERAMATRGIADANVVDAQTFRLLFISRTTPPYGLGENSF